jgi:hypothetical protein
MVCEAGCGWERKSGDEKEGSDSEMTEGTTAEGDFFDNEKKK